MHCVVIYELRSPKFKFSAVSSFNNFLILQKTSSVVIFLESSLMQEVFFLQKTTKFEICVEQWQQQPSIHSMAYSARVFNKIKFRRAHRITWEIWEIEIKYL